MAGIVIMFKRPENGTASLVIQEIIIMDNLSIDMEIDGVFLDNDAFLETVTSLFRELKVQCPHNTINKKKLCSQAYLKSGIMLLMQ
ncbi:hypothetical protein CEXT_491901 [Caerostris extrusa]|uniref:Uncharacterized protein n=1 Tax=Caerostris extrusa TaxID=172846 RepID=A0AAV4XQU6_CAEEX|nr:hypothetical protein CEXT_491901 [Caerostris extrusa]